MKLVGGYVYHVYNRGNNKGKIYYSHANYHFFLRKVEYHIIPYADILGWCLMPNHFHLMVYVNREDIASITINQSIGKMLSSYARAINLQEHRTGSLFQQHTKAICLNINPKLSPSWYKEFGVTKIVSWNENQNYPKICLDYLHSNPVNAGIVMKIQDWQWSSYHEIVFQDSKFKLVNLERLKIVVPL